MTLTHLTHSQSFTTNTIVCSMISTSHTASNGMKTGNEATSHKHTKIHTCTQNAQEIADARNIRNQILTNFELATKPNVPEQERRRLLHFVVVGGGPTGVEFGAEFYDFFQQVWQTNQLQKHSSYSPSLPPPRTYVVCFQRRGRWCRSH